MGKHQISNKWFDKNSDKYRPFFKKLLASKQMKKILKKSIALLVKEYIMFFLYGVMPTQIIY